MSNGVIGFGDFLLDVGQRRLTRRDTPVELAGRYFDALALLAANPGQLVSKDRFLAEVWSGVPVTDDALTQCIRSLRRALGDDAAHPRFIETVPKHGYRFIAPIDEGNAASLPSDQPASRRASLLLTVGAGVAGGAAAGLVGGIGYGLLAATDPPAETGAISIVLVMTCLCLLVGLLGGLGVGAGVALGRLAPGERLFPLMLGGALGGFAIGSLGRLVGLDAFSLLIGSRPAVMTGGSEGLLIGALTGASLWVMERNPGRSLPQHALIAGLIGAVAGLLVVAGGGQLMAGSLAGLAGTHPHAPLGALLARLPDWVLYVAAAVEGATFVTALTLALRGRPAG